tara:strand:- start:1671 stop:1847 length:177 start_codon:yes stop_codon:yes gene_type:complete
LTIKGRISDCVFNIGSPLVTNEVVDRCEAFLNISMFAATKPAEAGAIDWEVIIEFALS